MRLVGVLIVASAILVIAKPLPISRDTYETYKAALPWFSGAATLLGGVKGGGIASLAVGGLHIASGLGQSFGAFEITDKDGKADQQNPSAQPAALPATSSTTGRVKLSDTVAVRSLGALDRCLDVARTVRDDAGSILAQGCHSRFGNATDMEESAVRWHGNGVTLSLPGAHGKRSGTVLQMYVAETRNDNYDLSNDDIENIGQKIAAALSDSQEPAVCLRVLVSRSNAVRAKSNAKAVNAKSKAAKSKYTEEIFMRLQTGVDGDPPLTSIGACRSQDYVKVSNAKSLSADVQIV